jgi:hypothetical protein
VVVEHEHPVGHPVERHRQAHGPGVGLGQRRHAFVGGPLEAGQHPLEAALGVDTGPGPRLQAGGDARQPSVQGPAVDPRPHGEDQDEEDQNACARHHGLVHAGQCHHPPR